MQYELRPHTADVGVAASADTLEETFAALAEGLAAASWDGLEAFQGPEDSSARFDVTAVAESREALLFEYLDELIYQRDIRLELPVDNRIESLECVDESDDSTAVPEDSAATADSSLSSSAVAIDRWRLEASAHGISLESIDAREIKAITYADMRLEETDSGWEAYVVFDV